MSSNLYAEKIIKSKRRILDDKFELRELFYTDYIKDIEINESNIPELRALNISLQSKQIEKLIRDLEKGVSFRLNEEY